MSYLRTCPGIGRSSKNGECPKLLLVFTESPEFSAMRIRVLPGTWARWNFELSGEFIKYILEVS